MWPHQFVKDGAPRVVGEERIFDNTVKPKYAQKMSCVHCRKSYIQGQEQQPIGSCPARSDNREMKRIKNG